MEEFFASEDAGRLLELLGRQPAWSSLPLIVLSAGKGRLSKAGPVLKSLANVVLLERPARIVPLVSAVRAALAARRRQYEIRDYIEEMKRSAEERDRLYQAAEAARAEAEAANRMKDEFLATLSPRAADAAQRHPRLGAGSSASGKVDEEDMEEGLAAIERNSTRPGPAHRGPARHLPDHLGQLPARGPAGRPRTRSSRRPSPPCMPAATAKGIRIHKVLDSLAGPVIGRPGPAPAGRLEPAVQRGQVHAQGRQGAGAPGAGQLARRGQRHRHRHGHPARVPAARLRPLPPGRLHDDAAARRPRARAWPSSSSSSRCTAGPSGPRAPARARGRPSP